MAFDYASKLKPVLKWAGGKTGPLPQLITLFPASFQRFVEPFLGAGTVFLSLEPGRRAHLNDTNAELVSLYETIRDVPEALATHLNALESSYSEAFYYEVRNQNPVEPVARAARTVFLNKTGFNGLYRLNRKGLFNVPFGKRPRCPALYKWDNLAAVSQRLKSATLTCQDFEHVVDACGAGDFIYCDPPYEPVSKTASFTGYTACGFMSEDQDRLEAACTRAAQRGALVAVSNSSTVRIVELYTQNGWQVFPIQAKRAINSKGSARGAVSEILAVRGYSVPNVFRTPFSPFQSPAPQRPALEP